MLEALKVFSEVLVLILEGRMVSLAGLISNHGKICLAVDDMMANVRPPLSFSFFLTVIHFFFLGSC